MPKRTMSKSKKMMPKMGPKRKPKKKGMGKKGKKMGGKMGGKGRCWDGYKPTPGKKPFTKGSCMKA